MRFGTKILLLTLQIAAGTSLVLAWVVTLNLTTYENRRADERISAAIAGYVAHLQDEHEQVEKNARDLLEAQEVRSRLPQQDEVMTTSNHEQFRQEILGRNLQTVLTDTNGAPAFHLLLSTSGQILVAAAPGDAALERSLGSTSMHWPVEKVIDSNSPAVDQYVLLPSGLYLAMGVPLRAQLNEAPTHAYFVGFRVDDTWLRQQLIDLRPGVASDAPLAAWFQVGDHVYASASSRGGALPNPGVGPANPVAVVSKTTRPVSGSLGPAESIHFNAAGERYVGEWFELNPGPTSPGRLVLASSLDQALQPLRELQKQILLFAIVACLVAVVLCRWLARRLARPVQELVAGTQKIAAGEFDQPITLQRRDELGQLGRAMNAMAGGLKERDALRDHRTKIDRDLAVARKIQTDVLPKTIPQPAGYDIATYSLPAEQTGGDIFDLVQLRDQPLAPIVVLLADATGHGIGPAISVTQVRAMLRIGVRLNSELETLLTQINRQLCQDLDSGRFVTAFLGQLDPAAHTLRYYSAGQAPLLHFHAADQSLTWLEATMTPLGVMEDDVPGLEQVQLAPGDLFVLLTDGFYEYHNTAGEQLDIDRVGQAIVAHHTKSAADILKALLAVTESFATGAPQLDDMTAIIIKRS